MLWHLSVLYSIMYFDMLLKLEFDPVQFEALILTVRDPPPPPPTLQRKIVWH